MLREKLNEYLNRKELSKKAVDEVIAILAEYDHSSKDTVEELVEVLFSLKSDAIYSFVCKQLDKIPNEHLGSFIELCQKSINPNKITHAFALSIALCKQAKAAEANAIISYLVQNHVLIKKINKQIYASFERALNYEGAECLFGKWCGNDERTKNGYRKLLIEFLKAYPKPEYANSVTKWFNSNGVNIYSAEQEVINEALDRSSIESSGTKEVVDASTSYKTNESMDLDQVPIPRLLETVNNRYLQISKKNIELGIENKSLKSSESALTDKLKSTEQSLRTAENTISSLCEKVKIHEYTISDLNRDLSAATEKIIALNNVIDELNSKLSNVESAYGHAGQQEIDLLKGQIKKRLASEYSKYMELKGKAPDLDYYEILIDMLDEIYHVLCKNGIKFD